MTSDASDHITKVVNFKAKLEKRGDSSKKVIIGVNSVSNSSDSNSVTPPIKKIEEEYIVNL